jgi:hypothetical protein
MNSRNCAVVGFGAVVICGFGIPASVDFEFHIQEASWSEVRGLVGARNYATAMAGMFGPIRVLAQERDHF